MRCKVDSFLELNQKPGEGLKVCFHQKKKKTNMFWGPCFCFRGCGIGTERTAKNVSVLNAGVPFNNLWNDPVKSEQCVKLKWTELLGLRRKQIAVFFQS